MDMAVIQEFSENQCYLNALNNLNKQGALELELVHVSNQDAASARCDESLERILQEPISKMLFRYYLTECNGLQYLLALDAIKEYDELPDTTYRNHYAAKVMRQQSRSRTTSAVLDRVRIQFDDDSESNNEELFCALKVEIMRKLKSTSFISFLYSDYYRRMLAFRLTEARSISANDFTFIRILGEGGFGKVYAVSKNDTRALYAIKMMNKERIAAKKRKLLLQNERNILACTRHPFLVSMYYAFQDVENLYLVLDLMSGGELRYHLQKKGPMPEDVIRFYGAGILLAIEYLHSKNIVYRDLKLENVMLDEDGYLRLTDMGLCAFNEPGSYLHQHCGTRSYMAPEQCYGNEGYERTVDWWSFGICLFVLATGMNPLSKKHRRKFQKKYKLEQMQKEENKNDQLDILTATTHGAKTNQLTKSTRTFGFGRKGLAQNDDDGDIDEKEKEAREKRYPQLRRMYHEVVKNWPYPHTMSAELRDLCEKLITINYKKRLGYNGADEVKTHPFFKQIDFYKLQLKHVTPPFVPDKGSVNAKYVESAMMEPPKKSNDIDTYNNFDFTRSAVLQEEIMRTIHDKTMLAKFL